MRNGTHAVLQRSKNQLTDIERPDKSPKAIPKPRLNQPRMTRDRKTTVVLIPTNHREIFFCRAVFREESHRVPIRILSPSTKADHRLVKTGNQPNKEIATTSHQRLKNCPLVTYLLLIF